MSARVGARTYLGIAMLVLVAVAVLALKVVWEYLLSPGRSDPELYKTYMTIAVASTFALASLLAVYKTYKSASETSGARAR